MNAHASIPNELRQWKQVGLRLKIDGLLTRDDFDRYTSGLSEDGLNELTEFYERAVKSNDLAKLNEWFAARAACGVNRDDEPLIRNILILFYYLGKKGYRPFTKYDFRDVIPAEPNWASLPTGFEFVRLPAENYHGFLFEEGLEQRLASLSDKDRSELRDIAEQIRRQGCRRLQQWHLSFDPERREVALVSELLMLLDELEIPYC